ncbi:hypothetical protein [Segatella maculosa]|nr:hypothetical protein [Segatella maculosa]
MKKEDFSDASDEQKTENKRSSAAAEDKKCKETSAKPSTSSSKTGA